MNNKPCLPKIRIIVLTVITLTSCSSLLSQDWQLINPDFQYHYGLNDSEELEFTMKIDSIKINDQDTTFFFNRGIYPCDTCETLHRYVLNSPYPVDYFCKKEGKSYSYEPFHNFTILANQAINSSWIYNEGLNITAKVSDIKYQLSFGISDTVQIITLSNKDTLIISKTFGILQLPDLENDNVYTLQGVQIKNQSFGNVPINVISIFNFEVGDKFYYKDISSCFCDITPSTNNSKYMIEILEKKVIGDTIRYLQQKTGISWATNYTLPWGDTTRFSEKITQDYVNNTSQPANYVRHQLYKSDVFSGTDAMSFIFYGVDLQDQIRIKGFGSSERLFFVHESGVTFDSYMLEESLNQNKPFATQGYDSGSFLFWKEGLGIFSEGYFYGEASASLDLVGSIKNGIEHGRIFTDEDLMLGLDKELVSPKHLVYPSVFSSTINIKLSDTKKHTIIVMNIHGESLIHEVIESQNQLTIDTHKLPAGLFVIQIISSHHQTSQIISKQ